MYIIFFVSFFLVSTLCHIHLLFKALLHFSIFLNVLPSVPSTVDLPPSLIICLCNAVFLCLFSSLYVLLKYVQKNSYLILNSTGKQVNNLDLKKIVFESYVCLKHFFFQNGKRAFFSSLSILIRTFIIQDWIN